MLPESDIAKQDGISKSLCFGWVSIHCELKMDEQDL